MIWDCAKLCIVYFYCFAGVWTSLGGLASSMRTAGGHLSSLNPSKTQLFLLPLTPTVTFSISKNPLNMCPGFEGFFEQFSLPKTQYARNDQLNIFTWLTPIRAQKVLLCMHRDPILGLEKYLSCVISCQANHYYRFAFKDHGHGFVNELEGLSQQPCMQADLHMSFQLSQ